MPRGFARAISQHGTGFGGDTKPVPIEASYAPATTPLKAAVKRWANTCVFGVT